MGVNDLPDPDWYLDNVLIHARPRIPEPVAIPGPIERWQAWWMIQADDWAGDAVGEFAVAQGFVAGRKQLLRLGLQDHDLRRLVRSRYWSRPDRGVVSPVVVQGTDYEARRQQHALRGTSAALLRPGHVITGRTAAIVHGLPTLAVPEQPILTTWGLDAQGRRQGVHVRAASLDPTAVTTWFGAPLATVARAVVDLARGDRRDGIMAADAALREAFVTPKEWDVELVGAAGWPGIRQAREVVALANPAAESALESLVRLALHDDGFPAPELQFKIDKYRVDFCWPRWRLVLEADGRGKYTDEELWREKVREAALRARGYRVERVLWAEAVAAWPSVSRRLRERIRG